MRGDLIFYHDAGLWPGLIQWATKGPYNHVAIDCGDYTVIEATLHGVQHNPLRPGGSTVSHQSDERMEAMRWLFAQIGDPYDFYDIALAVLFSVSPHTARVVPYIPDDHYICSELAAWYLRKAGYPFSAGKESDTYFQTLSPNGLYVLLEERKS